MALSDACFEFIQEIWENGFSPMVLQEFRDNVEHYSKPPFRYPEDVSNLLIAAVDEFDLEDDIGTIVPSVFLSLVALTLRTYDCAPHCPESELFANLNREWPGYAMVVSQRAKD
jgi:hypothetical protein